MARTYYAEGRQVAYVLRGLFIIVGLTIYFKIPGLHWGYLFGILFGCVILGEISVPVWTRKTRKRKVKDTGSSRTTSTNSRVRKVTSKTLSGKLAG